MQSAPGNQSNVKQLDAVDKSAALRFFLKPLDQFFADEKLTEICINEPGVVWTESREGWTKHERPELSYTYCLDLARLIATASNQCIDETRPILSATLPGGQRCQVVTYPATLSGTVSLTIRKQSSVTITLDDYDQQGAFADVIETKTDLLDHEHQLIELKKERRYKEFIELAVQSHQNILISGATGSGKTTFAKAIIDKVPRSERLISIENVDELRLRATHPNTVAMFYSAGGQGLANVSPEDLMKSSLRQKPSRVFVAELISGEEAFYFMDTVSSGHPGSISTMHSETPALCVERLISLIRRSEVGRTMSSEDVRKLVYMCIDVIIQFKVVNRRRVVTEIYYDPAFKKSLLG